MIKLRYNFKELKDFIDSLEIGDIFYRKDIIKKNWKSSIDNYRNYFCKARYLEIVGRGKYKKIKNLPKKLTLSKLFKEAYFNIRIYLNK